MSEKDPQEQTRESGDFVCQEFNGMFIVGVPNDLGLFASHDIIAAGETRELAMESAFRTVFKVYRRLEAKLCASLPQFLDGAESGLAREFGLPRVAVPCPIDGDPECTASGIDFDDKGEPYLDPARMIIRRQDY